jgi:hypothetical protein
LPFNRWFPNHRDLHIFNGTNQAFDALESGEIGMVLTSEHQLLVLTDYREFDDYKTNFIFDYYCLEHTPGMLYAIESELTAESARLFALFA